MSDLCTLGLDPLFESVSGTLNGEDVFILNEVHRSKGLRKLHLEIAFLGDGLQILHCVFFPEPIFDLPVFGVDIVIGSGGVSAAIVDLSPVRNKLPDKIIYSLERLEKPSFKIKRDLPKWGDIFSSYVLFVRPTNSIEEELFLEMVDNYLGIFITSLEALEPEEIDCQLTTERYEGQISYCLNQKQNDKTRKVLEKAFSTEWTNRYIDEVLFDMPKLLL